MADDPNVERAADELGRIADILVQATRPPQVRQADNGLPRPFLSGRWHRRDGTVYRRVAEVGSPNAGNIHGHDPAGDLPTPIKR